MNLSESAQSDFIKKVIRLIREHISDEQFGVSVLAAATGMSRSNLLRKVQRETGMSVSRLIRQVRLKYAMDLLKQENQNISEIAFDAGFGSVSYFVKCFREQYGYPPGEAKQHNFQVPGNQEKQKGMVNSRVLRTILIAAPVSVIIVFLIFVFKPWHNGKKNRVKSIAVLPFVNDSNDSTNLYFINGLMESVLDNLQKIGDLRVVSRTSVEKYRNSEKNIDEVSRELNVDYLIEGSGQKLGNRIMLNVQLIAADQDTHLWSEQYNREVKDVFALESDIAGRIVDAIEVIVTPDEQKRIDRIPTKSLQAYDDFLRGIDFLRKREERYLPDAISAFKSALDKDDTFAYAWAYLAITYYYLEIYHADKAYTGDINRYADKALFLDPELADAYVAKALYYMDAGEPALAVPYLEKALEYQPNSAFTVLLLTDIYTSYIPDTEKYLEYALKGVQLNAVTSDSIDASFISLHLANALIQNGFVEEARIYIKRALAYDPDNLYAAYVKAYIDYAISGDLQKTKDELIAVLMKDTSRLDILQEVAKICYYLRDYREAYKYYDRFLKDREKYSLDIYGSEDLKIAKVFQEVGETDRAATLAGQYEDFAENDRSIYQPVMLAAWYAYLGDDDKALDQFTLFSEEEGYYYWIILFVGKDPVFSTIKDDPRFIRALRTIERKFWKDHDNIKSSLKEMGLI